MKQRRCMIFFVLNTISQKDEAQKLSVGIYLSKYNVEKNQDLRLRITIHNKAHEQIAVYKNLIEGYSDDVFANLNLIVERKDQAGFSSYSRGSLYQMLPNKDTTDNIERVIISHGDSIVHYYHLDNCYEFEPGEYRVMCIYNNNILAKKRIESNWIYFHVIKKVFVKKYYDE